MKYFNRFILVSIIFLLYIIFSFFYAPGRQIEFISNILFPSPKTQVPIDNTLVYSPRLIEIFSSMKKPKITSAILRNDYEGIIVDIQIDTKSSAAYSLVFRLRAPNNAENSFVFTKGQLSLVTIYRMEDKKKEPVAFTQLKQGDFLHIYEEIDLKQNWPQARKQFIITIIK